ncbi:hypothetical protein C1H46_007052 [Malus baccata]|uniref:Uncharacterized protein n=1 Tax=Malus baccata TaxID=106549 RepID=A0A540N8R5_MALBA|nr:hypothetical protein C1H46_007052 [Malus baccata]
MAGQESKEPCKKEACNIQACLSKNNFLPQKSKDLGNLKKTLTFIMGDVLANTMGGNTEIACRTDTEEYMVLRPPSYQAELSTFGACAGKSLNSCRRAARNALTTQHTVLQSLVF